MNDFIINNCSNKLDNNLSHSILKNSKSYKFHTKQHYYNKTPLVQLNSLSNHLCLNNIHIKDESNRFDLDAFKVLGSTYCLSPKKNKNPLNEIYSKADELKMIIYNLDDLKFAEIESKKVSNSCLLYMRKELISPIHLRLF